MDSVMSVRAPDELKKKLKRFAKKQGVTRNALILQILWEWVRKNEKPAG